MSIKNDALELRELGKPLNRGKTASLNAWYAPKLRPEVGLVPPEFQPSYNSKHMRSINQLINYDINNPDNLKIYTDQFLDHVFALSFKNKKRVKIVLGTFRRLLAKEIETLSKHPGMDQKIGNLNLFFSKFATVKEHDEQYSEEYATLCHKITRLIFEIGNAKSAANVYTILAYLEKRLRTGNDGSNIPIYKTLRKTRGNRLSFEKNFAHIPPPSPSRGTSVSSSSLLTNASPSQSIATSMSSLTNTSPSSSYRSTPTKVLPYMQQQEAKPAATVKYTKAGTGHKTAKDFRDVFVHEMKQRRETEKRNGTRWRGGVRRRRKGRG